MKTRGSKCLVFDRGPAPWDLRRERRTQSPCFESLHQGAPFWLQTISARRRPSIPTLILLLAVALLGGATAQWITLSARSIHRDRQQQNRLPRCSSSSRRCRRDVLRTTGTLLNASPCFSLWNRLPPRRREGCGSVGLQGLCAPPEYGAGCLLPDPWVRQQRRGIDWLDPDASVVFGTFTSAPIPKWCWRTGRHATTLSHSTRDRSDAGSAFKTQHPPTASLHSVQARPLPHHGAASGRFSS